MKSFWEWLKKNWKWFVLPIWALSIVLVWLFTRGGSRKFGPVTGTTDQAANTAVKDVVLAADERENAIKSILKVFEEKLRKASDEQIKEAETMKDKPASEIAAWIDKF